MLSRLEEIELSISEINESLSPVSEPAVLGEDDYINIDEESYEAICDCLGTDHIALMGIA